MRLLLFSLFCVAVAPKTAARDESRRLRSASALRELSDAASLSSDEALKPSGSKKIGEGAKSLCSTNEHVDCSSGTCVCTSCPTNAVNHAGDHPSQSVSTTCSCPDNYFVQDNHCVPCMAGFGRDSGDSAPGVNTVCVDENECASDPCKMLTTSNALHGVSVMTLKPSDGTFYDAVITQVNADGTYSVLFSDESIRNDVQLIEVLCLLAIRANCQDAQPAREHSPPCTCPRFILRSHSSLAYKRRCVSHRARMVTCA